MIRRHRCRRMVEEILAMLRLGHGLAILLAMACAAGPASAKSTVDWMEMVYHDGQHNAFTDLIGSGANGFAHSARAKSMCRQTEHCA